MYDIFVMYMDKTTNLKKLVNFLYETGTLRKIARSHRQTLLTDDLSDNISSHSYRVTITGWFLAKMENADPYKTVMMCLFHDTTESRTGDQNWVNKKFVKTFEKEVAVKQFLQLAGEEELMANFNEYQNRQTLEAKLAKDADLLDQIMLLKEYEWRGNNEATRWLKNNQQIKKLFSETAKQIANEIVLQKPSDWWSKSGWTADRR